MGEPRPDVCDRCGDELAGGSHWHCGGCSSTEETSMFGHYYADWDPVTRQVVGEPYMHCRPEEVKA